jgi:molybdopterin-synthase adenylyltransferase
MEDARPNEFSVAMTASADADLRRHLDKGPHQEDLTFATWRPSTGRRRTTAVLSRLLLPHQDERILRGNVAFTANYAQRVLGELQPGEGLVLVHSHLGPGWQDMSKDDVVAERDRLAGAAFGRTGLPVVGLTSGNDGSWSARRWLRIGPRHYERDDATTVRVVGQRLRLTFHPELRPVPRSGPNQVATVSVWGDANQADLARARVAIIGLGSVGSLIAEALARMGISELVLIDHDCIEERNLDRTAGAKAHDAVVNRLKVEVAERNVRQVATAASVAVLPVASSLLAEEGLRAALDADVIISCVDRPWPRHLLNAMAYNDLIPVIDGGIYALVDGDTFVHANWRIHTVGPGRGCLVCIKALDRDDVSLDIAGKLDDPDYIKNLPKEKQELLSRRNVFPFSMAVAAHETLHFVGCISGLERVAGVGPQVYHCYPGEMEARRGSVCEPDCGYDALTATCSDLSGNLDPRLADGDSPEPHQGTISA